MAADNSQIAAFQTRSETGEGVVDVASVREDLASRFKPA
jgi:hypothetical protein